MLRGIKAISALCALSMSMLVVPSYVNASDIVANNANEVFTENTTVIDDSDAQEEVFTVIDGTVVEAEEYILDPGEGYEVFVVNEADSSRDEEWTRNANIQQTFTLAKGASKTFTFTVNGGLFSPNHNSVSVVIDTSSSNQYQYIFENVTDNREIYNTTMTGHFSGTCSNMDPADTYEITIVNLGTSSMTITASITTYIS